MDTTRQDLLDLVRRGSAFAQAIRAARENLRSRDLADPHLRAAEHEVEDALLAIAEASEMLGFRPMQSVEIETPPPAPCNCVAPDLSGPKNPEGHRLDCPRWGTSFRNTWADRREHRKGDVLL